MIIGDFYINNFLVLGLLVAAIGGTGYVADVPSMLEDGDTSENASQGYEISLQGQGLSPGSSKTLQVINTQGNSVSEAEVSVNGEEVGLTNENGLVTFEVPDSSEISVSASKSHLEVTRTFDVEESSDTDESSGDESGQEGDESGDEDNSDGDQTDTGDSKDNEENNTSKSGDSVFIQKISPESSELTSTSFETVLELGAENASYKVYLGGKQKLSGELDGNRTVSSNLEMPRKGTVGLYVEILRDSEVKDSENYSLTYSSESNGDEGDDDGSDSGDGSDRDGPQSIDLGLRSPSNGETVSGTNVSFQFIASLRNAPGLDYEINVDDSAEASGNLIDGYKEYVDYASLGPGSYDYVINAVNESTSEVVASTDNNSFSVSSRASANLVKPQYDSYYGKVPVEAELKVGEDTEYRIKADGEVRFSGSVSSESNVVRELDLDEGTHTVNIELIRDSEVIAEDEKTFDLEKRPLFELLHPNESTVDDYETYFQFEVNNSALEASSYEIIIDGNVEYSGSISGDGMVRVGENEDLELIISESGDHTWKVRTSGTTVNTSEPVEFSTTESEPENINLELLDPGPGASVSGKTEFSWSIDAPEGSSYEAYWSTNESMQQGAVPFDGSGGSTEYSHLYNYNSSGAYSWAVEVQNSSTGDVIDSTERELYYEG